MQRIPCSNDRYEAHRDLEAILHSDEGRNYIWCHLGTEAIIRFRDEQFELPHVGENIEFQIDTIPMRTRGARPGRDRQRLYLTDKAEQQVWIRRTLLDHAGLAVENVRITSLDTHVKDFFKPGYRFKGTAFVVLPDRLENALQHGVGDSKAYGYGMLII